MIGPAPAANEPYPLSSKTFLAFSCVVLVGGLVTIGVTIHMVVVTYSSLPYSDAWTEINAAVSGVNLISPQWLWQQHNEHRIVLPKLFLAADLLLFHSRQIFTLASILTIQFAHLMLLSWSVRILGGWTRSMWRLATGLMAFCLFCPSQWENFVWPFQTCFVLPGLFATLSFVALLLYSRNRESWGLLLLSLAAALGAQYSLANGNLLWPLLLVAAIYLHLSWHDLSAYVLTGAISTTFFFRHYIISYAPGRIWRPIFAPGSTAEFTLAYLGSAWSDKAVAAVVFGSGGVALTLLLCLYLRRVERSRPLFVLILLTLLFCMGTALMTAVARLHLGLEQALASRYQTPVLLFWGELALLLLLAVVQAKWSQYLLPLFALCVILVFLRGAFPAVYPLRLARWHGFQVNAAAAAIITGVDDPWQFYLAAVDSSHMVQDVEYLKQRRLSIFAGKMPDHLQQPLASVYRVVSKDRCTGALQSVSVLPGSDHSGDRRISGWAWDRVSHKPASYIVAVDNNRIVGFGAMGDWRPMVRAANHYMNTSFIGFTAYAEGQQASPAIDIYAVLRGTPPQACQIAAIQP